MAQRDSLRLVLLAPLAWLGLATPAAADPATVILTVGSFKLTAGAVYTVVAKLVISAALQQVAGLFRQRPKRQTRQGDVLRLSIGASPREVIYGRALTGGSLVWPFNFGGANETDWECLVIAVADHRCDALEAVWVGDEAHTFAGDGPVAGFGGQLEVYWRDGRPGQSFPDSCAGQTGFRALAGFDTDDLTGVAYLVALYKYDPQVWSTGRPSIRAQVRGRRVYDWSKDSTVPGGAGPHRWNDPSTREWSENAWLCRADFARGIYHLDDDSDPNGLLLGRGLPQSAFDIDRALAAIALCNEAVPLAAGGTEPRYRVGGVIGSDRSFDTVEQLFADAMAGDIVQPSGGVDVLPGDGQAVAAEITDGDLLIGQPVSVSHGVSPADRINTVVATYVDPDQLWQQVTAPIRTVEADVLAEGPLEEPLDLELVTSVTQAQRVAEIRRRKARLEREATLWLGPRFSALEEGDWIGWTSASRLGGARVVFQVVSARLEPTYRTQLALKEIAASVYAWDAEVDEITSGDEPYVSDGTPPSVAVAGLAVAPLDLGGVAGLTVTWAVPVDPAVTGLTVEVRSAVGGPIAATRVLDVSSGQAVVTSGVSPLAELEVRLVPEVRAERTGTPTGWLPVTAGNVALPPAVVAGNDLATVTKLGASEYDVLPASLTLANPDGSTPLSVSAASPLRVDGRAVSDATLDLLGGAVGVEITCTTADPTLIRVQCRAARLVSIAGTEAVIQRNIDLTLDWDVIGLNGRDSSPPGFETPGIWGAVWLISDGAQVGAIWSRGEPVMPTGWTYRSVEPISEALTLALVASPTTATRFRPYSQDGDEVLFLGLSASSSADVILESLPVIVRNNGSLGNNNSLPTWAEITGVRATAWGQATPLPPTADLYRLIAKRGNGVINVAPTNLHGNSDDALNPPPIALANDTFSLVTDVQPETDSLWVICTNAVNELRVAGYRRGRVASVPTLFGLSLDFATATYESRTTFAGSLATATLTDLMTGTVRAGTLEGTSVATGALVESGRSNRSWATDLTGAATGTLGSGGALPTGWHTGNSVSVASVEVLSLVGDVIEVRVTPDGTAGAWVLQYEPTTTATMVAGQAWTGSFDLQQIGAAPDVTAWQSWIVERDGSGGYLSNVTRPVYPQGDTLWPVEHRHTVVAASGYLTHGLAVVFAPGANDPVTFKVRRPQLELGGHRTSPIASVTGGGSRALDLLELTPVARTVFGSTAWTTVLAFRPGAPDTGTVMQWASGAGEYRELAIVNHVLRLRVVSGGVEQASHEVGPVPRWRESRLALAVRSGQVRASLNGAPVVALPVSMDESRTVTLGYGATHGALNGALRSLEAIRNAWLTDTQLRADSALTDALYDDFARSDRLLIGDVAASGQTYGGVEAGENVAVTAPTLSARHFVAPDSGTTATAAYLGVAMAGPVQEFGVVGVLDAGASNDSWTLISGPNGLDDVADITDDSLHVTFTESQLNLGYFDGGAPLAYIVIAPYAAGPLTDDGETHHALGYRLSGNAIMIEYADGTVDRFVNSTAVAQTGLYTMIEPYRFGSGAPACRFRAVLAAE